jgi:hypothetical protein
VLEFKKKHDCKVIVSTFWNHLFENEYPEIEFVVPGTTVHNLYAMYTIGWFYNNDKEPVLPNTIPLQQTITNILGLEFKEIKPNIHNTIHPKPYQKKYVTIATNSTSGCKFWTRDGWQKLINHLVSIGYKVINVSKEDNPLDNCEKIVLEELYQLLMKMYPGDDFFENKIREWLGFFYTTSSIENIEHYFNTVKKFSLMRDLELNGFRTELLIDYASFDLDGKLDKQKEEFNKMTSEDILAFFRDKYSDLLIEYSLL